MSKIGNRHRLDNGGKAGVQGEPGEAGTRLATRVTSLPRASDRAAGRKRAGAVKRRRGLREAVNGPWGGTRNRASRTSDHLNRRQVDNMLTLAARFEKQSKTFNRHWTVHYERAGVPDSEGAEFVRAILKRLGEAVRRAGGELYAIWARENPPGGGAHVHILMCLPDGFSLRNRTRRWIEAAGGTYRKGVSRVSIIGGTLASARADGDRHRANVANVLSYLCKNADPATGRALGLSRYGERGRIIGKRCGWTQNLRRGVEVSRPRPESR